MSCICHAFASVHSCLVVTCWERIDLLALVCAVYCDFVTFLFGILGLVWCLIVSIPGPFCLSYFHERDEMLYTGESNMKKKDYLWTRYTIPTAL